MQVNVCSDPILMGILESKFDINSQVFDTILSPKELNTALEEIENFSSNWFKEGEKDFTLFKGVSIGAGLHDDINNVFTFVYIVSQVIQKIVKGGSSFNEIVFHQSVSCKFPSNVLTLFKQLNITVKTYDELYPYYCYSKDFHLKSNSLSTTGIYFWDYALPTDISFFSKLVFFLKFNTKLKIKRFLQGTVFKLSNKDNTFYISTKARLIPILKKLSSDKETSIYVKNKSSAPKTSFSNRNYLIDVESYATFLFSDFILGKKGKMGGQDKSLIIKSLGSFLSINSDLVNSYFSNEFCNYYCTYKKTIENYISWLKKSSLINKFDTTFSDYYNSFAIQLLDDDRIFFYLNMNRVANNQTVSPNLRKHLPKSFKVLSSSSQERERLLKQKFDVSKIIDINEYLLSFKKDTPSSQDMVLINPPFLGTLCTYRWLSTSESIEDFFRITLLALKKNGYTNIIVRPHPGLDNVNAVGFSWYDAYQYFIDKSRPEGLEIFLRKDSSGENIAEDIDQSKFVLGTVSSLCIEAALRGKDYIAFDNSIIPFEEGIHYGPFSESGPLERINSLNRLNKILEEYDSKGGSDILNYYKFNSDKISLEDTTAFC